MRTPIPPRSEALFIRVSPHPRAWLTSEELAEAVGISRASLGRIVRLGLLEGEARADGVFSASAVARLRRMLRLRRDLGMDLADAGIVANLMDRMERLEAELDRMRGTR